MASSYLSLLMARASTVLPGSFIGRLPARGKFVAAGLKHKAALAPLVDAPEGTAAHTCFTQDPVILGLLIWPYQSAMWEAETRLERLVNHCGVVDTLDVPFHFSLHERLVLLELEDMFPGLRLVMDQPKWFRREGHLVVNLFLDDFRAFCIAFSFYREADGSLTAVIGGTQGRNREDALTLYRDLTKALHGLRPRDFLLEVLRMVLRAVGVTRLLAVPDGARHHRHPYFGGGKGEFTLDYDEIWQDRGGVRLDNEFYELPVAPERRSFDSIKPKKRSLYRKRFEFLDRVEADLGERLPHLTPVEFEDS